MDVTTHAEWPGVSDPSVLKPTFVEASHRLADAARDGRWDGVLALLASVPHLGPNRWRVGGTSWFAPLHQAAWLGAPVEVVEQLVALGAWRSLRDADDRRPVDLARERGHDHLLDALATPTPTPVERRRHAAWDAHLETLVAERTAGLPPVAHRRVATEVVQAEHLDDLWFAYPGMYGGFSVSLFRGRLHVESWSRVAGGSGQAHVITEDRCTLVDAGFA